MLFPVFPLLPHLDFTLSHTLYSPVVFCFYFLGWTVVFLPLLEALICFKSIHLWIICISYRLAVLEVILHTTSKKVISECKTLPTFWVVCRDTKCMLEVEAFRFALPMLENVVHCMCQWKIPHPFVTWDVWDVDERIQNEWTVYHLLLSIVVFRIGKMKIGIMRQNLVTSVQLVSLRINI